MRHGGIDVSDYLFRIKVGSPWNLDIWEQILVSGCGNGSRHVHFVQCVWVFGIDESKPDVGVRCNGGSDQEEGLVSSKAFLQETIRLASEDISRVLPFVADGRLIIALKCCIEVVVGERVKQEV